MRFFPANAKSVIVLEPRDRAFDYLGIMILTPLPTRVQPMPSPPLLALGKVQSMKHS